MSHENIDIKDIDVTDGKLKLRKWLNMNFRIEMTDGRVLIGVFLCTDRDANVILESDQVSLRFAELNHGEQRQSLRRRLLVSHNNTRACSEYLKINNGEPEEPRILGLVMVPGRHIVSIQIDDTTPPQKYYYEE